MQARKTEMTKTVRARYTLEFKQGGSATGSRRPEHRSGGQDAGRGGTDAVPRGQGGPPGRRGTGKTWEKRARTLRRRIGEVGLHSPPPPGVGGLGAVPSPAGQHHR